MSTDARWGLIEVERRRAASFFADLDDAQLDTPSLCDAWSVREVLAHLASPFAFSPLDLAQRWARTGTLSRFSVAVARELAQRPAPDLTRILRANATTRFAPPGMGPGAPLTDLCVHLRDAARPLGLEAQATPLAWRAVLDFLVGPRSLVGFRPRGRYDGLRLLAGDLPWGHGDGALVAGPAEALALALAGRPDALPDLRGDGVVLLASRISSGGPAAR